MEAGKEIKQFDFDEYDGYEWYLKLGSLANINPKYLGGKIPTWNDYASHPNYDAFWKKQSVKGYLTKGHRSHAQRRRVVGPGGLLRSRRDLRDPRESTTPSPRTCSSSVPGITADGPAATGTSWARSKFGTAPSRYYREKIQRPFFAHFLKDGPDPKLAEATVYETGANKWVNYNSWPTEVGDHRAEDLLPGRGQALLQPADRQRRQCA
jgi:hypothetical protein